MGLIPVYLGPSEAVKEDLMALDGFDLAFLILIDQVIFTDSFDVSFELVQKAAKAKSALWGPQAILLGTLFKRAWKGEGQFIKEVQEAFNLSGDVSVDSKKIDRAFKNHLPKMGQRIWQRAADGVAPILTDLSLGSAAYCVKQFHRQVRKADTPVDPLDILFGAAPAGAPFLAEDFMAYYERATGNHLNAFASAFPERTLHPEVERLVKYAEQAPGMRVIDKADLTRRIERISSFGDNYFSNMTDIQAGHLWNFTALEMAHNAGVSRYQVLSQRDKKTCPVCKRLDGKTFDVKQAYDKIQQATTSDWHQMALSNMAMTSPISLANATAKAFPFPRMNQIDNMSSAQVRASGWFAPFHGRCFIDGTEVLTDQGWLDFKEIKGHELFMSRKADGTLEYVKAIHSISYHFDGELVRLHNRWFDLCVTPDHSQPFERRLGGNRKRRYKPFMESITGMLSCPEWRIPRTGKWIGLSSKKLKIFAGFMAHYLSEGSVTKRGPNRYQISFSQNEPKLTEMFNDITQFYPKAKKGRGKIYINNTKLGKYLIQFGKSYQKFVPVEIKNASPEIILWFLKRYRRGDGYLSDSFWKSKQLSSKKVGFHTSSNQMASDLGEMILKAGGYPAYSKPALAGSVMTCPRSGKQYQLNHDVWHVACNRTKYATHQHMTKTKVPYTGIVRDVELEWNHVLCVRYKGKVCFSGNCRCQTIMLWKKGAENAPLVPYDFKDLQMHYGKPSTLGAKFMGPLQKKVKKFAESEVASEKVMWSAYKNCQTTDHPLVVLMHKETGDVVALARVRKLKTMLSIDQLGVVGNASGVDKQMLQTVCLIAKKDGLAVQMEVATKNVASMEALGAKKLKSGMFKFTKGQTAAMADNLNPLIGDMTFMSWETTAAQEVVSVATAVPKKPKTIPKPKVKTEPVKPKVPPAPTEVPEGKWEMIPDTQLGSNPGGQYIGPDGNKYYVKFYKDVDQARSELAATQIAQKYGLQTFDTKLVTLPDADGVKRVGMVTQWKAGGEAGTARLSVLAADEVEDLTKQYLHACLTGNWDVIGADYDNLVYFGKRWQCVDYGGTFQFRAQGGLKDFLAGEPTELISLLDPKHKAGGVFSKFVPDELSINAKKYMKWLNSVSDDDLKAIAKAAKLDISVVDTLKVRKDAILLHLGDFIDTTKESKKIKRRIIEKTEIFKKKAHQTAYNVQYKKYQHYFKDCPKDDLNHLSWSEARQGIQEELRKNKKMITTLYEWQVDSTADMAHALRLKATNMEKTKLSMVWKDYMDVAKITKHAQQIPDIEYIRIRASTQAYLDARGDTTLLWRGIAGSTGHDYQVKLKEIKKKFVEGKWRKKFMEIDESGLMGWSSDRSVSESWADVLMRDQKPNLEVLIHNDIWPKSVHENELETICLGFNKRKLQLGKELGERKDIFN